MGKIKKVVLAKPGLDGHDVGVKVIAHALIENGYDVVYTGLRKSIEFIVDKAEKENAHAIGLSILSGTHKLICQRMHELMNERNLHTPWFVGGNIPQQDVAYLESHGAHKAFPTGTTIEEVLQYLHTISNA